MSNYENGLFSWRSFVLQEEEREILFEEMEKLELTALYQSFPKDADPDMVRAFLEDAQQRNISVYLLTGDPGWGLDESGAAMKKEIERAAALPGEVRGVMMDVEPYLTEEWDADRDQVMQIYVDAMERACEAAEDAGLELIACIPYFYDDLGQISRLEELVERGCHALAVMNYDKGDEAENLKAETEFAHRYERPVTTIYELQEPGKAGLSERNTYYQDGLGAVKENWRELLEEYPDLDISYALHDYTALKEVLDRE